MGYVAYDGKGDPLTFCASLSLESGLLSRADEKGNLLTSIPHQRFLTLFGESLLGP